MDGDGSNGVEQFGNLEQHEEAGRTGSMGNALKLRNPRPLVIALRWPDCD